MRTDGRWPRSRATRSACRPAQTTTASAVTSPRVVSSTTSRTRLAAADDLGARQQPGAAVAQASHEHGAHGAEVDDPGLGDVQGGDGRDVRLVLARLGGGQPRDGQPVGEASLVEVAQGAQLGLLGRDDELAGDLVRDPLGTGEVEQRLRPGAAPARLEAAGWVVEPGVDDAAVAPGLVARPVVLLLEDGHLRRRVLTQHALGDGQADDPAADDGDAVGAGHGTRRVGTGQPASPARCAAMMRAYSSPESLTVRTWVS